tara:strand:- start:1803 stop:2669 length:867 start_codon:yes stop_codon:yes gene_type:complete
MSLVKKNIFFLLLVFFSNGVFAQINQRFHENSRPLYELGLGAINIDIPYYPGSKTNQNRTIPFIWPVYRGKYLRIDQEGTRAKLTDSRFIEFSFSLGFSFPINSNDNPVREGLKDIDYIGEIGPRIIFRLISDSDFHKLNFNLSLRSAFEVSSHNLRSNQIGLTGGPSLTYWIYLNSSKTASLFTSVSLLYGDSDYNNFFYGINEGNRVSNINKYKAFSGEISRRIFSRIAFNLGDRLQLFFGGFYANLSNSKNISSPLIEQDANSGFATGFLWNFFQSDTKVKIYGN